MAETVRVAIDAGLATLWLERAHGNAINRALAEDLIQACAELERAEEVRGVLLAGAGKLFCPGLDLQELIELDRASMERFLASFNACVLALYSFPKPLLARLHGHAVAGGCVLSLTADWRVLREGAMVGLNEVRVGVPFPYGVAQILRDSSPANKVEEIALFGRNYRGREAVAAGLVHETHAEEGFDEHCRARLEELAGKDPRAFSISKRYLRSEVVARIRAHDERLACEFIDSWFSPATRAKVQTIVDELRNRAK